MGRFSSVSESNMRQIALQAVFQPCLEPGGPLGAWPLTGASSALQTALGGGGAGAGGRPGQLLR
jgi:hypothetical protein